MNNLETPEDWNREAIKDKGRVKEYIFNRWGNDIKSLIPIDVEAEKKDTFIDNIVSYILMYKCSKEYTKEDTKKRLELRGGVRKENEYIGSVQKHIEALKKIAKNNLYEDDILRHLDTITGLFSYGVSPISVSIRTKDDVEELIKMELSDLEVEITRETNKKIKDFLKKL